ncbi:MAG TPA: DUF6600 domain-containing protein, partial [Thermoanaerobaculia bacterium]|nr:DUF6600 domain-containing protein [Thermoanaerobaculia bacterium]
RGDADEPLQAVARVSYIAGAASYNRGDDPDAWQPASVNFPLTLGDRVYTGRDSRMELQAHGATIYLSSETELAALNFTRDVKQLSLGIGAASFRIRRLSRDEVFEIDTPNAAVTFDSAGSFRVDVDADGSTHVVVRQGRAVVAAGGGEVPIAAGEEMEVWGLDRPEYDVSSTRREDTWDRWVEGRARRLRGSRAYEYVNYEIEGADDLDSYGGWEDIPDYGMCWSPSRVEAGWQPYRLGRWAWQDPWGWTWCSSEPWGWAPYHYGRWVSFRTRWYWVPVGPRVSYVSYAPALVAFVGGGPGWSASLSVGGGGVSFGGGYVGWFPLAPRDPLVRWWGARASVNVAAVANVTYVNRSYATVVNRNVFVSGGMVQTNAVRDTAVVRQMASAPILRGPLPVMPTRESFRVSTAAGLAPAPKPPSVSVERSVVTRLAPPPAPPRFERKLEAIREKGGAPLAPAEASRLSVETRSGAAAVRPIRPVVTEPGSVTLVPRRGEAPRPQAVTAPSGKVLATPQRPIVAAPEAVTRPETHEAPRPAPGAVIRGPGDAGTPAGAPPGEIRRAPRVEPRPETPPQPVTRPEEPRREVAPRPEVRPEPRPEVRPEPRREPPAQQPEGVRPAPRPSTPVEPQRPREETPRPPQRVAPPPESRPVPPPEPERRREETPRPPQRVAPPPESRPAPPPERREPPPAQQPPAQRPAPPPQEQPRAERPAPPKARPEVKKPPKPEDEKDEKKKSD